MPKPSPTGNPRSAVPARRAGTPPAGAVRAMLSVTVLAFLLAGLPLVLWWGTAIVGPPALAAVGHLFTTQDSGQVFLLALAALGWSGWALFTLSVAVEIPSQLRGRTAPQLRLLIGQRTAATLISAILMALPTGTALAAAGPAHATTTAANSTVHPENPAESGELGELGGLGDTDLVGDGQSGAVELHGQLAVSYTVQDTRPAESLWSIAQDLLGDGNRWEEIADLNTGSTMNDGTLFHADAVIRPGWTLHLPAEARPTAAASGPPAHNEGSEGGEGTPKTTLDGPTSNYTVRPGDTLSAVAETQLGDRAQYPEIFELNQGEQQPGGHRFTDPDVIYPGQHLDLPTPAAGHGQPPSRTPTNASPTRRTDSDPTTAEPHNPTESTEQHTHPATPVPTTGRTTATPPGDTTTAAINTPRPEASPTGQPSPATHPTATQPANPGPQPGNTSPSIPAPTAQDQGHPAGINTTLTAGIGMLLAAGLAGALAVKRILQHRRRHAGETIAIDPDPTPLEQILNTTGPAGVTLLDTVLRTLAAQAATDEQPLPTVRGARVTDRSVQLIVDDARAQPLPPFTGGPTPGTWVLDPAHPLLSSNEAHATPAPYPALVTLGASPDGDLVLSNLLHPEVLLLDGESTDVLAVTRALALEAGTAAWTDHTDIVIVGLGTRLATLLPRGRVQSKPHLPAAIADLGALLLEIHQSADKHPTPEPLPWLLICASDVEAEHAWQLADALSAARNLPVAIVLPASDTTRQVFPHADHIPVAPGIEVTLPRLSTGPLQLQRLTDEQYRQYIHALEVADQPAEQAHGAWQLAENHTLTTPRPGPALATPGAGDTDPSHFFPALINNTLPAQTASTEPGIWQDKSPEQEDPTTHNPTPLPAAPAGTMSGTAELPEPEGTQNLGKGSHPAPSIDILGPLHVTGINASGHGPKVAALSALIFLRPGRTAEFLCNAIDPHSPWSTRTLQSRLSEIRTRLGNTPTGDPYLPRPRNGTYQFTPGLSSDWTRFQNLATRALTTGPPTGTTDLEKALALVRGKPFDGHDYPWADAIHHEIRARITDIAHTLATWHTNPQTGTPDPDAARTAVLRGLDIDETAEVLYRDWMHIEWTTNNHTGIRKAITRTQQTARTYDITLEPLTQHTINLVLSDRTPHTNQP